MPQGENPPAPNAASKKFSNGIAIGIVCFLVGAGASFLGLHFFGPEEKAGYSPSPAEMQMALPPAGPPAGPNGFAAKGRLTSIVGALEALSRENPNLKIELDPEQSANIAAELAKLEAAASLTEAEAQSSLQALEAALSPQQKEIVDSLGAGPIGGAPGENPFTKEENKKRLEALLRRIEPAGKESARASEE